MKDQESNPLTDHTGCSPVHRQTEKRPRAAQLKAHLLLSAELIAHIVLIHSTGWQDMRRGRGGGA